MIRAHMASFPPRAEILMQAVTTILPQVDRLYLCLNEYDSVPPVLGDNDKIVAVIPGTDLKDAGKFAFAAKPDDMVFTVDDDILYPPDYVTRTLAAFDQLDPAENVVGYLGHAWVLKQQSGKYGWRNFMFQRGMQHITKVDVLGTGTTCQLGRHLPALNDMITAAGFVDLRHARLHHRGGRSMWILPRDEGALVNNMRPDLQETSLFRTVNRRMPPVMMLEQRLMMQERQPYSGLKLHQVMKQRAKAGK